MKTAFPPPYRPLFLLMALTCGAQAAPREPVLELINAYRAAPPACDRRPGTRAPALANEPGLARIVLGTGTFLELALERAGYAVQRAEAIHVSGAPDAAAVMATIEGPYCRTLQNAAFTQAGVRHTAEGWLIVFLQAATPPAALPLPDLAQADRAILAAVNSARAQPRSCGALAFDAAAPLAWNDTLAAAARAHSEDMARQGYFDHQGKDGRRVTDRARQAGYEWRRIAENIAAGQESAQEVVDGWITSPGHCANIMNPDFTDMGAAHGISTARRNARVYWTQVLGSPR